MKKKSKAAIGIAAFFTTVTGALALFNKAVYKKSGAKEEAEQKSNMLESFETAFGKMLYEKTGSGKPVVLIHSLYEGASYYEWKRTAEVLSKFYTVYNINLLGFGYSDKPNMVYSSYTYASILQDFIEKVIKSKAYVIASNTACDIAAICASSSDNIAKLMLVSPKINSNFYEKTSEKIKRILIDIPILGTAIYNASTGKKATENRMLDYFYDISRADEEFISQAYITSHTDEYASKYAYSYIQSVYMNSDIKNLIKAIKIPCGICWGEENENNPIKNMEILEEEMPEYDFFIFEKTKEFPHIENAEEFAYNAHEFLN